MFVSLILIFYSANNQSIGQTGVKMELISTKMVNKIHSSFMGDWYSTDTTQIKGLIIKLMMSKTPEMEAFNTGYLFMEVDYNGEKGIVPCQGLTFGFPLEGDTLADEDRIWFFNDIDAGKYFNESKPEEEKIEYQDFLFPIPLTINSGVLKYETPSDTVKIEIKWDKKLK